MTNLINIMGPVLIIVAFISAIRGKLKDAGLIFLGGCILLAFMNDISLLKLVGKSVTNLAKDVLIGGK